LFTKELQQANLTNKGLSVVFLQVFKYFALRVL